MAEAALLGVANSVLGQLSSPALKEVLLLWNFDEDLDRLRQTIQTITAFLHDAEQRESKEQLVKLWLSRLRAILYDADDLFDAVAARALRKKAMSGNASKREVRLFFSKSNQLSFIYKTAGSIKAIRERLDHINNDMVPFKFQSLKVEENFPLMNLNRKTHSFVDVKKVIGRDEDREKIISLLLSEKTGDRNLSVISIIGFGGLGKTTLAQLVYNDDRVQNGFDLLLWVCINYFSDLELVLQTVLASAVKSKPQDLELDQLQVKLRESIGGKKILLVLDDVWEEDASNWDKLETLLNCGKAGSMVLATTRNTKVAQCLESMKPYYRLNLLSEDHAWSLFEKLTFGHNDSTSDHSELVPLGKEIVRKCGRVPLALITIGRMLRSREKNEQLWSSFIEKELPDVLGDDTNNGKLMEVLKLSYNYLPSAMKYCFAYCSLYPKDHEFDKDELVRMWVAQGFLKACDQKSLEEVGDECFFYMIDRCFFQEVTWYRWNGTIRYRCKMHDLLHDLAIQVAGSESGCFIEGNLGEMVEGRTLRHISAIGNPTFPADQFSLSSHSKTLRTLLLDRVKEFERSSLNSILSRFKVLRVLQLSNSKLDMLPDSFGELIHLRCLDLSWNRNLKALPNSVCKLYNLQSLILVHCLSLVGLPSKIGKLGSLRHLLLSGCVKLDSFPLGFEALTALVTLRPLVVDQSNRRWRSLGCLDNLCGGIEITLPVKGWSNWIEDLRNLNMSRKHKLNGLTIKWIVNSADETAKEETQAALEELKPHQNLQYLEIEGHVGDKLSSWVFSLSKLKEVVLEGCTNLEYLEDNLRFDSFLTCLESLTLDNLPNLKGWWREVALPGDNGQISKLPSLSRVSNVVIDNCPELTESMPLFLGIETLRLSYSSGEFVSKLMSNPDTSCSSFEPHYYCCKLKELDILFASGLRRVSADGLANLTALESLSISDCGQVDIVDKDNEKMGANNDSEMPWKALRRLRSLRVSGQKHLLQDGLQYLTALEELGIEYYKTQQVEADNECGGIILWKDLKRLQTININYKGVEEEGIYSFPNWVQYLPSLKVLQLLNGKLVYIRWTILANMKLEELKFWNVEKVVNVDEMEGDQQTQFNSLLRLGFSFLKDGSWLHQLPWKLFPSLRTLELFNVKNLRSIPNGIQHLTSLKQLSICWATPEIVKRCKAEVGEDWPLISHIPTIHIEWKDEDGNYQKIDVKPRTHRRS